MKPSTLLTAILIAASFSIAKTSNPIHTYDGTTYWPRGYGYAAATVYYDGVFHQFFCSEGLGTDPMLTHPDNLVYFTIPDNHNNIYEKGYWDFIRYRTSKNGETYTGARLALTPSRGTQLGSQAGSENCTCDPAIIKYGEYWYLYYTGNVENLGTVVYVARSKSITGPFKRYTKQKRWEIWPKDPMPILQVKLNKSKGETVKKAYGLGQQSVVVKGDTIHFWFSYAKDGVDQEYKHMKTTRPFPDTTNQKEWSSWETISIDGITHNPHSVNANGINDPALALKATHNDFGEVRWNPNAGQKGAYQLWMTSTFYDNVYRIVNGKTHDPNKIYLKKYESSNGINWHSVDSIGPYCRIHNVGVSSDEKGWIKDNKFIITFSGLHKTSSDNSSTPPCRNTADQPYDMYQIMIGDNQSSALGITNGFTFPIKSSNLEAINGDYDGDGITDLGVVDRANNQWYIYSSQSGNKGVKNIPWGHPESKMTFKHTILVADYDGDGKTDIAFVDKANAKWYIRSSRTREPLINSQGAKIWDWGYSGMNSSSIPLTGDYDGDGKADIGFVNPSTGTWYIKASSTARDLFTSGENKSLKYGKWEGMNAVHKPIEGDYDGDGKTDLAIHGTINGKGTWFIISSQSGDILVHRHRDGNNIYHEHPIWGKEWGVTGWEPIIGDFDGDGKSDLSIVYSKGKNWKHIDWFDNESSITFSNITKGDQVLVGDYDGDGKSDEAVFVKSSRKFFVHSSRKSTFGIKNVSITHLYNFSTNSFLAKAANYNKDIYDDNNHSLFADPNLKVESNGSLINISNLIVGQKVLVYNMKGEKVLEKRAFKPEISFTITTPGTYVLKSNAQMINFSVK